MREGRRSRWPPTSIPGEGLCLRPEDVILASAEAPVVAPSSRNHVAGTITRLIPVGPYVRAILDCGLPLVALVTHRSVEEPGLREGTPVVALFKATAPQRDPSGSIIGHPSRPRP